MPKIKLFDKTKVLEAASNTFRLKGYNGTSIDELLIATGISRSSLYFSFHDKHNLYLQSLEFDKNSNDQVPDYFESENLNGFQKIEALFQGVVDHLLNDPENNTCFPVNSDGGTIKQRSKTFLSVYTHKEEVQEMLSSWLSEAQNEKRSSLSKSPKVYSQFLYNTLCGLRVMSQNGTTKAELDNVVRITLDTLN